MCRYLNVVKNQNINLFLFIIFISKILCAHPNVDARVWQVIRLNEDIATFKNTKNNSIRATSSEIKGLPLGKQQDLGNEKFIRELTESKRKTLTYVGVNNWQLLGVKVEKSNKETLLKLHGTYVDSEGVQIGFVEIHRYLDNKTFQYLYIEPVADVKNINFKLAESFTKVKYQP